jgi:hypothetical protein
VRRLLRTGVGLAVVLVPVITGGCGSSSSGPTTTGTAAVTHAVLPPATAPPVTEECDAPITENADGTVQPLLCAGGAVNVRAWQHYAGIVGSSTILGLGRSVQRSRVVAALCAAKPQVSAPILDGAYRLASAYYGWHLGQGLADALVTGSSSCR